MKLEFDVVKPNLLVVGDEVYITVSKEDLVPFARDVDEVLARQIGQLQVRERDIGVVAENTEQKKSKKTVSLKEYLAVLEQKEDIRGITNPSYELLGGGDYVIDAWILESSPDVDMEEITRLRRILGNLGNWVSSISGDFGVEIDGESARRRVNEKLETLEKGVAERFGNFWVINGLAPVDRLNYFYDGNNGIIIGRVALGSKNKEDEKLISTKNELVERLRKYNGHSLSLDAPQLMEQAYRLNLDGPNLMAHYGDILDNPNWRKRFILFDG